MSREWVRLVLTVALVGLIAVTMVPSVIARVEVETVRITIRNAAPTPRTVRVLNAADATVVVTLRMEPNTKSPVSFPERPFLSPPIDRYDRGAIVQVLDGGCEVVEQNSWSADEGNGNGTTIWIGVDPLLPGVRGTASEVLPVPVEDPCSGGEARPTAMIYNRRTEAIAVAPGFAIPACSERLVRPGDLPAGGFDANPAIPVGAVRIDVPSIAAQDERWPMELRRVVVHGNAVEDDKDEVPFLSEVGACGE